LNTSFQLKSIPVGYIEKQISIENGNYIKIIHEQKILTIFNIYYIVFFLIFIYLITTKLKKCYECIFNLLKKKTIKHIKFNETMNDLQCTICLEEFILKEKICILECNHIFHIKCINNWIITKYDNAKCPNCNSNIITFGTSEPLLNRLSDT
jgi:hypothetical protein